MKSCSIVVSFESPTGSNDGFVRDRLTKLGEFLSHLSIEGEVMVCGVSPRKDLLMPLPVHWASSKGTVNGLWDAFKAAQGKCVIHWPPMAGFPPKEISVLLEAMTPEEVSCAVASRFLGSSIRQKSGVRVQGIRLRSFLESRLKKIGVSDPLSDFFCFKKELLETAFLAIKNSPVETPRSFLYQLIRQCQPRPVDVPVMWIPQTFQKGG